MLSGLHISICFHNGGGVFHLLKVYLMMVLLGIYVVLSQSFLVGLDGNYIISCDKGYIIVLHLNTVLQANGPI